MAKMKLLISAFIFSALLAEVSGQRDHEDFGWGLLDVSLPKPLSDHTAIAGTDGLIYIAGGCDAADGNVFIAIDENEGFFACGSLSSSLYSFDPNTLEFEELADLPRARYRHSSSFVGNEVWIIGGRTLDDTLIPEIDVYNIDSKSWSTVVLPAEYVVSDHAGFAQEPNYVFMVGGYDQNYTALDFLTRIDATTLDDATLGIEAQAPLRIARGDIVGVTTTDGLSAFISGGFTHANKFCSPLGSTERYSFASNEWEMLPNLVNERGEVVLVEVENQLYAMGGERQIEGVCNGAGDGLDVSELTVGTDEVETLDPSGTAWEVISGFPRHKFRFAAAADGQGIIYAFGGQTNHDNNCQCFKTTADISVFGKGLGSSAYGFSTALSFITVGALVFAMGI